MTLRRHVNSDITNLDMLHQEYSWVPDRHTVRPREKTLNEKMLYFESMSLIYKTITDLIMHTVFNMDTYKNEQGLLVYKNSKTVSMHAFKPNMFPYDVSEGTNHYIMWYNMHDVHIIRPTDEVITRDISDSIRQITGHDDYDFIWYYNPKMSICSLHVQVFWVEK